MQSLCLKEAAGGEQISSQVRDQWATQSSSAKTEERLRGKKKNIKFHIPFLMAP